MDVKVLNGDLSQEEINAYIDYIKDKHPDKHFKQIELSVDGEFIDIKYTYDEVPFERIRRITGYLVGTIDRFNDAKRAEVHDRVKHNITCECCEGK